MIKKLFFVPILPIYILVIIFMSSISVAYESQNQGDQKFVIKNIDVITDENIDPLIIKKSLSKLRVGYDVSLYDVNIVVKDIYSKFFLDDISANVDTEKGSIIINVKGGHIVKGVKIRGNTNSFDFVIKEFLSVKKGMMLKRSDVQKDMYVITDYYKSRGRPDTDVSYKITHDKKYNNIIDVTYLVKEGDFTPVGNIEFFGNKHFSNDDLKTVINSRKYMVYHVFDLRSRFFKERIGQDIHMLENFYKSRGFLDFTLLDVKVTSQKEYFDIKFFINEGEEYTINNIKINSDINYQNIGKNSKAFLEGSDLDEIIKSVNNIYAGDVYTHSKLNKVNTHINGYLFDKGLEYVILEPNIVVNKEHHYVELKYNIVKSRSAYIRSLFVKGNEKTLDRIILREIDLASGDVFDSTSIERSRQKILALGFLENVDVRTKQVSEDQIDIEFDVEEAKSAEIKFNASSSNFSSINFNVEILEKNLFGTGTRAESLLNWSYKRSVNFMVDLYRRRIFDSNISSGIRFFGDMAMNQESLFNTLDYGIKFYTNFMLLPNLSSSVFYFLKSSNISKISDGGSLFLNYEKSDSLASYIGYYLNYDNRSFVGMRKFEGFTASIGQDIAGLGGTENFIRNSISVGYSKYLFKFLHNDIKFKASIEGGLIGSYVDSQSVKAQYRYFVGMNKIRGFDYSGIGPIDDKSNPYRVIPLGGKRYFSSILQMDFPLGIFNKYLKGSVFLDIANLTSIDIPTPELEDFVYDANIVRVSTGVGFSLHTFLGPMRFDFGFPLRKDPLDRTSVVRFLASDVV